MKKWLFGLLACWMLTAARAEAEKTVQFDHSGAQKGAELWSCAQKPCSLLSIVSFTQREKTPEKSVIALRVLLGAAEAFNGEKVLAEEEADVIITCSLTKPSVQIDDHSDVLPLNTEISISESMYPLADFYMQACHHFQGTLDEGIARYGYNVQE